MTNFTAPDRGMRMASLMEVGAQFRQSHGIEFAKALMRQLGADEATLQLFVNISTSKTGPNMPAKSAAELCRET